MADEVVAVDPGSGEGKVQRRSVTAGRSRSPRRLAATLMLALTTAAVVFGCASGSSEPEVPTAAVPVPLDGFKVVPVEVVDVHPGEGTQVILVLEVPAAGPACTVSLSTANYVERTDATHVSAYTNVQVPSDLDDPFETCGSASADIGVEGAGLLPGAILQAKERSWTLNNDGSWSRVEN